MRKGELTRLWLSWRTLLVIVSVIYNPANRSAIHVAAEGYIGCLFAESLCIDGIEFCYDDFAFGKCTPQYSNDVDDMVREPLTASQSSILATMLQELQGAGLNWDHPFVQCRIQGALFALRLKTPMPQNLCVHLAPAPEIHEPQSPLAYVRFTPPQENDYLDDVYFPPPKKSAKRNNMIPPPMMANNLNVDDLEFLDQLLKPEENYRSELNRQQGLSVRESHELERMLQEAAAMQYPNVMDSRHQGSFFKERQEQIDETALQEMLEEMAREQQEYKEPKASRTSFRELARSEHIPEVSYFKEVAETEPEIFEDGDWIKSQFGEPNRNLESPIGAAVIPADAGVYTEGGVVYLPGQRQETESEESREEARDLLANMLGFTRRERLDVKKPGPPAAPPPSVLPLNQTPVLNKEIIPAHFEPPKTKKLVTEHSTDDHGNHSVDTDFAHVVFKNPIDNWRDGERIVLAIAEMLNMNGYLTYIRVDQHEVSFRVKENPEKKTADEVAKAINDSRFKNNLSRRLGVNVIRAGIGDKTKAGEFDVTSSKLDVVSKEEGTNVTHIMVYMFVGAAVAALIVAGLTFFVIKRHDKKKDKLGGLSSLIGADSCSKDYQELCRARMAGRGNETSSGRITTLSKENERPPSSRSSTSSWSEEPMTNMDISTGHMVLSYMEDHLRNKGRLQREWEALCRYEAEPNSRDAALQEQCEKLNRDGAPLPYDHSRVVLNHLANAEGLDYINASTITDHDPRAPAYVAAQGPMQSTVAHFWQMVWEQGAVVIVALCRLQENGEISCTRYWPEEGAETYHIYEVHLVSEHIWCDDYLVRSFYLKNLQTGETRTVTQFHFLTWPQNGVPVSAKALLEFRRKVNKSYRGRSCPIVVHSSNGAGRTGAYILLDLVLARMNKGAREIDIAATLEHLRDQRAGLVESRAQFEFVLMAVAEEVHAILKALPSTTASEKRDLDKETVKENENEEKKEEEDKTKKATPKK